MATAKHKEEGLLILLFSRVCFILFRPTGILLCSDPRPRDLLVLAANVSSLILSLIQSQLVAWLHNRITILELVTLTWIVIENVTEGFTSSSPDCWILPLDIYEALSFATSHVSGKYLEPVPKAEVHPSMFAPVATVENCILGNPAWHQLLIIKWQLQPGEPFVWEPEVLVMLVTSQESEKCHEEGEIEKQWQELHDSQAVLNAENREAGAGEDRDGQSLEGAAGGRTKEDRSCRVRSTAKLQWHWTEAEDQACLAIADIDNSLEDAVTKTADLQKR
ncbi:hypothetical protein B0H11DRAFT_1921190 [Mycena galericulata]|nr:hypothetical protein B0H11DRAFT_1941964 [Mycena galericulata]KAJ7468325.1 hypothetical protein B0H11DRAFT_1921190 [Mycena galericulata]